MIWVVIAALAAGTLALKTLGPVLAGGVTPPAALSRVIELLTPALLAALIVVGTVADGNRLTLDARLVGVGLGAVVLLMRAPLVVALVVAAAGTAVCRLAGWLG